MKILIPVDFTDAANKAVIYGTSIAQKSGASIQLLHVFEDDGLPLDACKTNLQEMVDDVRSIHKVECDFLCEKGNIFNVIPDIASKGDYMMMVIATHGARGLRQKVFGPDILKLLKKVCIPSLVVQRDSIVPGEGIRSAVLPVGGHDEYDKMIQAMITIAGLFNPEIHLYSIVKPGFEHTNKLKENIRSAENAFSEKGIGFKRVAEDQNVFSVGFAKQTLKYAAENNAYLISIMVNATRENYYFADSDKQAILTNEHHIPVLCASNMESGL